MYQEEAERVVALCASDVPCIAGAERPMESREEPVPSIGLEFLVEEAHLSPLTVIATGPATDVAASGVAGERVRRLARRVRGRSQLQGLGEQDGRDKREGRYLGLAHVAGSTRGSPAHPHVALAGEDTGRSDLVRRGVARSDGPSPRTWPRSCSLWPPSTRTGPEKNCGTWPVSPPSPIQEL
jgi:hypothetical protein